MGVGFPTPHCYRVNSRNFFLIYSIFPSRSIAAEGAERYAAPMSPLECLICTSRNRETFPNNSVYEHVDITNDTKLIILDSPRLRVFTPTHQETPS